MTEQGQEQELHLLEHLTELRKRILITLGTFLVALCAAFLYVEPLYEMLTRDVEGQLQVLGPTDVIWVYFMIAGVIALAVTIPVAGFQVWRFVVPGLSTVERRASLAYIPAIGGSSSQVWPLATLSYTLWSCPSWIRSRIISLRPIPPKNTSAS